MGDHDHLIEAASTKSICESDYMEFWAKNFQMGLPSILSRRLYFGLLHSSNFY